MVFNMSKMLQAGFYSMNRRATSRPKFLLPSNSFWTSNPVQEEIPKSPSADSSTPKIGLLTRRDIAAAIAEDHDIAFAKADRIVKSVFDIISEQVATKKEEVFISGFGKYKPSVREAHIARNPSTGEEIKVPRKASVKFQASKNLKEMCNSK